MAGTESVLESVLVKLQSITMNGNDQLSMVMTESVKESVFSKALVSSYKQESFTKNGSDGVCAGVSF